MTQENRQLLLRDLCARLPYGVKAKCINIAFVDNLALSEKDLECIVIDSIDIVSTEIAFSTEHDFGCAEINSISPYLRPMSSMTVKEENEFISLNSVPPTFWLPNHTRMSWYSNATMIDWLLAHHFDFRGLIEKGLALEALPGMYD